MTDHELLALAAKTAGFPPEWEGQIKLMPAPGEMKWRLWNPLTDDGDALRLAAKLRLDISNFESFVDCEQRGGDIWPAYDNQHGGDRCAAIRRAITRAAAGLAKDHP